MPIISVSDIWKILEYKFSDARRHRQAVIEWLESVYDDLDELSKIWREMVVQSMAKESDGQARGQAIQFLFDKGVNPASNARPYCVLWLSRHISR